MSHELSKNENVKGYTIISEGPLNVGAFASSYKAKDSSGNEVFFKQYSDPTCYSDGFDRFNEQQEELKKRFQGKDFVEEIYEVFVEDCIHFQAKEFFKGMDLFDYFKENPGETYGKRRLISSVCVYSLKKVHELGVIHTDLKPQQIYLKEDPSVEMGFNILVADFDFSKIPGEYEPFYNVFTPFYQSPEHIKGEEIDYKSDIFTMGLILYEILIGYHPCKDGNNEEYEEKVLNYEAKSPKGIMEDLSIDPSIMEDSLSEVVHRMIDPDKSNRPDLSDVHDELLGNGGPPIRVELRSSSTDLYASFYKTKTIKRDDLRVFGNSQYVSREQQFIIKKHPESWFIEGMDASNETFLNNENITRKTKELQDGDKLFIGNPSSGEGLELKVKFIYED